MVPTIIFYEAASEQAKERPKVVKALVELLDEKYRVDSLAKYLLSQRANMGKNNFEKEEKALLKKVIEAMVAIKLALRLSTYERWQKWCSLYGISKHSMVFLTNFKSETEAPYLFSYFETMYARMAELRWRNI